MKNLLETNIYEPKGKVLICGTCLPKMQPDGYDKLAKDFDMVLTLCLERDHINMAITKICAMLSIGQITELIFASVNKSPHCAQLHYIKREIRRAISNDKIIPIFSFVIEDNRLHYIPDEVVDTSQDLVKLAKICELQKKVDLTNEKS